MKHNAVLQKSVICLLVLTMLISLPACKNTQAGDERNLDDILASTSQMLLESTPQPAFGSVGGEWMALGLARWNPDTASKWLEDYYLAVEAYVADCDGVLHDRKYTEYSRLILALTAIGKDPTDVAGYNLLVPLADFEQTIFQGINGPVYALLALDSGNYTLPEGTGQIQATRQMYVDFILSKELPDGGWSLAGGAAETDITAMTLQALAKYRDRQDVADAVDRALTVLSNQQNGDGGFTSYDVSSCESVAQVILALTELGIPMEDPRFVKNGNTLVDRLYDFLAEDAGFKHVTEGETSDLIATEQAFYALVSLYRTEKGLSSLYRIAEE